MRRVAASPPPMQGSRTRLKVFPDAIVGAPQRCVGAHARLSHALLPVGRERAWASAEGPRSWGLGPLLLGSLFLAADADTCPLPSGGLHVWEPVQVGGGRGDGVNPPGAPGPLVGRETRLVSLL